MTAEPAMTEGRAGPLLEVKDLAVEFPTDRGPVRPVDGVSFHVQPSEILGLVGESGCGKTLTTLAVLGLIPPPGRVAQGSVQLAGRELTALPSRAMQAVRGREISLIPSDAGGAMNPVTRVGDQVLEAFDAHAPRVSGKQRRERMLDLLRRVGLPDPPSRVRQYPHELSGGMQQRVVITESVILGAKLLIADEPTTALDVTIQAQILRLLLELRQEFGLSILFVSHDLATITQICDRVMVMYAGQLVEQGPVREVAIEPRHPYTKGLLDSVSTLHGPREAALHTIAGSPPAPGRWPSGCRFAPRCPLRARLGNPEICETTPPPLAAQGPGRDAACHFSDQVSLLDRPDAATAGAGPGQPGQPAEPAEPAEPVVPPELTRADEPAERTGPAGWGVS
jgi:oligopeptide/dipeptide ABC transporter ATP-binding protein